MFQVNQGLYVGKDYENGYLGYIAEDNLYAVVSIEDGMTKEQGKALLKTLKEKISQLDKITLTSLDAQVSEILVRANVPLNFSLSLASIYNNILYLKTIGDASIYIRRSKDFDQIITGDNRASGYIHEFDFVVLTNNVFGDLLGQTEGIKTLVGYKKPKDIVTDLYAKDYGPEDTGLVALFMEFVQGGAVKRSGSDGYTVEEATLIDDKPLPTVTPTLPMRADIPSYANVSTPPIIEEPKQNIISNVLSKLRISPNDHRRTFTMVGVGIISLILIWSVVLGRQRQLEAQRTKKVEATTELVTQKLTEADDVAFLNLDRSLALITEAQAEVAKLKKEVGTSKEKEVAALELMVKEQESKITKKEEKKFEEFYDLALEDKNGQGSTFYLDGDTVAILDTKGETIYLLSLAKKSIEKKTSSEVAKASLVAQYEGTVYFYSKGQGIFQFTSDSKVKKVIANDKDWDTITDLDVYNGNLYVLDTGNDEVYKYIVASNGFSDKTSYFQSGQSIDLSSATSLAIDSAVYIANGGNINKYVSGIQEEVKTSFPESDVEITKVFATVDDEKLYAWDKKKGSLYVLTKDGTYELQIQSSILAKGQDLVVYEGVAYILFGAKIYEIEL